MTKNAAAKRLGGEVAGLNFGEVRSGKEIGRFGRPSGEPGAGIYLVEGVVAEPDELPFDLIVARRTIRGGEHIDRLQSTTVLSQRFSRGQGLRDAARCPVSTE
jgi:hypothetical protein